MKKNQSNQSLYHTLQTRLQKELKHFKHQKALLKLKLFLLIILPTVIALLAIKTAQVWLGIKLREVSQPDSQPVIKPVKQEVISKEWVTPTPVSDTSSTLISTF